MPTVRDCPRRRSPADAARRRAVRRAQLRRRRAALALVVALVVVVVVSVAGLGGGGGRSSRASDRVPELQAPPNSAMDRLAAGYRAVDRTLGYTPFIEAGTPRAHEVALTFDDGPSEFTPKILALLQRERVPGTFFQVGEMAKEFPEYVRAVLAAGYPIGNHTQTHPAFGSESASDQEAQIDAATANLRAAGAPPPRLFRPPGGSFDDATLRILKRLRMLMVMWTADTEDYTRPGEQAIVDRAVSQARPGGIVLMHDGGGDRSQTVAALPRVIARLRAKGFRLVTVPELVLDDPPPAAQRMPDGYVR